MTRLELLDALLLLSASELDQIRSRLNISAGILPLGSVNERAIAILEYQQHRHQGLRAIEDALTKLRTQPQRAPSTPPSVVHITNHGQIAGLAVGPGSNSTIGGSVTQTTHTTPTHAPQKTYNGADVLIICALKDEQDAVLAIDTDALDPTWTQHTDPAGYPYHTRRFQGANQRPLKVAVAQSPSMGGTAATLAASRLVTTLKPRCLAMCGICAGKRGDVALGDVIVADRVFAYDYGKLVATLDAHQKRTETVSHDITTYNLKGPWKLAAQNFPLHWSAELIKTRPLTYHAQGRWLLHTLFDMDPDAGRELLKSPDLDTHSPSRKTVIKTLRKQGLLEGKGLKLTEEGRELVDEEQLLGEEITDRPFKVHVGPIAAGNKVVEDPEIFDRLKKVGRKTLGLEMEGAAIGMVAELEGVAHHIVVKAVVDHADDEKDDQFRSFACAASAQFLLAFLQENLTTNPQ